MTLRVQKLQMRKGATTSKLRENEQERNTSLDDSVSLLSKAANGKKLAGGHGLARWLRSLPKGMGRLESDHAGH